MTDDLTFRSTIQNDGHGAKAPAESREQFELRVATAVVVTGFAAKQVAADFGISTDEVRDIFKRREPDVPNGESSTVVR